MVPLAQPKRHLDRFSHFVGLTIATDRQRDRQTDKQTDTPTDYATSVTVGRIYVGLRSTASSLEWPTEQSWRN